jgi:hypothetical protein
MKFAPMKKTIYSLGALREVLGAANRRYGAEFRLKPPVCGAWARAGERHWDRPGCGTSRAEKPSAIRSQPIQRSECHPLPIKVTTAMNA